MTGALEASDVNGNARLVLDVEAVFLAAEPRGGGDRSVGLPVADFDADGNATVAAGHHFVKSGLADVRQFHATSVRPAAKPAPRENVHGDRRPPRVTRSVPESVHIWASYRNEMRSGSDQPNDQAPDERRAARDKRWALARAEDWHAERPVPPTPLRPRAKERLRSLKPTDIPSRAPGDEPQDPTESV